MGDAAVSNIVLWQIREGDLVVRKSYGQDIVFKVVTIGIDELGREAAILRGARVRLMADAPLLDLIKSDRHEEWPGPPGSHSLPRLSLGGIISEGKMESG